MGKGVGHRDGEVAGVGDGGWGWGVGGDTSPRSMPWISPSAPGKITSWTRSRVVHKVHTHILRGTKV